MFKEFTLKKYIALISFNVVIILLGVIGSLIYSHYFNNLSFLYIFLISYPFSLINYLTLLYIYHNFNGENDGKIKFLISYGIRFISIIASLLLSVLYLRLNFEMTLEVSLLLLIPVTLFILSYVEGVLIK